ncbi:MAG: hypothetical protein NTW29_10245 [Bacteroidetes bacterium]|nr:hypothetical protein [Bacteroidota bacterium]
MIKKLIPAFFIFFAWSKCSFGFNNFSQYDKVYKLPTHVTDTLVPFFTGLSLQYFSGKPVDTFLSKIPVNYAEMKIGPGDQLKKAHFLYIRYSIGVSLAIYIKEFNFMKPHPPASNWNITLLRKESIDRIEIYNGVNCINGCQSINAGAY